MIKTKEGKIQKVKKRARVSRKFVIALSVVSIIGFFSIMTESLFNFSIGDYIETLWLFVLGGGLILETSINELKKIKANGLNSNMLGKVTMIVVGTIAVIAAILSLPQINMQNPTFLAIKGIISILAIIFIIIQTWISKKEI
ncbi:MAG: hypothetical protein KKF48_05100 [Nanoarchaeota archaeon]|nr:hypothetical protein [Nanoarchaeota archaeon]MBU1028395.1 hypothetical protein [Nanoarchaeota archaeon]